ncbi:MAG TPA: metal-dependent hydrolase [Chloroflexi bacterium]|nr:metal-dependent hydrolase [Chloroflexota bacterium]
MKGIAHFITGVAVATFFPEAVRQAADGSLILVLGGVFGLLPDTLDFKFARYFEHHDDEIDPHPQRLDPREMAERVAAAMRAAYETGTPRTIQLHTLRLGADLWRRYSLRFIPETGEVALRIGPVVSTSQVPLPGSEPPEPAEARVPVGVPIRHTYDAEIPVDIFSGPSFRFEREGEAVRVTFLPWHRSWSHSLVLALGIGLGVGVVLSPLAGWIAGLAFAAHVLEDQLGFMGSNLFWPFTRRRFLGLRLLRSTDPLPNFLTVWLAVALILFNLDRFSFQPRLPTGPYLVLAVLLPLLLLGGVHLWQRQARQVAVEATAQGEILEEAEEA